MPACRAPLFRRCSSQKRSPPSPTSCPKCNAWLLVPRPSASVCGKQKALPSCFPTSRADEPHPWRVYATLSRLSLWQDRMSLSGRRKPREYGRSTQPFDSTSIQPQLWTSIEVSHVHGRSHPDTTQLTASSIADTLVVAGEKLTVWKLDETSSSWAHWRLAWETYDLGPITAAVLSPCRAFVATTCKVMRSFDSRRV